MINLTNLLTPRLSNLCKKDVLYIITYFQAAHVRSHYGAPLCNSATAWQLNSLFKAGAIGLC